MNDPTHVRAITGEGLALFSRKANEHWRREGSSNTPLAFQHGIDFDFISTETLLEEPWASERRSGALDDRGLDEAVQRYNNVIKQQQFVLKAVKPR
jgi:hypothetical protein